MRENVGNFLSSKNKFTKKVKKKSDRLTDFTGPMFLEYQTIFGRFSPLCIQFCMIEREKFMHAELDDKFLQKFQTEVRVDWFLDQLVAAQMMKKWGNLHGWDKIKARDKSTTPEGRLNRHQYGELD